MPIKKRLGEFSLFVPIFFEQDEVLGDNISIPFSKVAYGQALYGDKAKGIGSKFAWGYAKKHNRVLRVLELVVKIQNRGPARLSLEDLEQGASIMSLPKLKVGFKQEVDLLIQDFIRESGVNVDIDGIDDYVSKHPDVVFNLFERYKGLNVIILNTKPFYAETDLTVALLHDKNIISECSFIFDNSTSVSIS